MKAVQGIDKYHCKDMLVGGFNHLEKHYHILWKIKNVPNHKPDWIYLTVYSL
jgi:hypothetical protein